VVTGPAPPRPVDVTGGSGGIAADCESLAAVAGRFGEVASAVLGAALKLHGVLLDARSLPGAFLDPGGFAAFEAELLWALDGPHGLSAVGAQCGALDLELRAAAASYQAVDDIGGEVRDLGLGLARAGPALIGGTVALARTRDPVAGAQAAIAADPEAADVVVDALGVPALLAVTAAALPDGRPRVTGRGIDRRGAAGVPPRSLADVVAGLAERDADGASGAIDVRILTLEDGSRRVIVDITGTRSWDPLPTRDVTSLTTNERALVGQRTAYEAGVLTALRRAGVRPTDPVMLVGHSEGGMVAVGAARDAVRSHEFDVTHVITAGAPIGRTVGGVPRSVQILALENRRDVVPQLDGRANPDRSNVTTVVGDRGDGTVLGDHAVDGAYLPLATDAQSSESRSVRDFLAGADGYFRATSVTTHRYQVERRY
jgi:hypothetical protein